MENARMENARMKNKEWKNGEVGMVERISGTARKRDSE
jgi:hypothetical protein